MKESETQNSTYWKDLFSKTYLNRTIVSATGESYTI